MPVVRKTGGLNDTVFDVDDDEERASSQGMVTNGYNFEGTDGGWCGLRLEQGASCLEH